jgi:hypothetical protein
MTRHWGWLLACFALRCLLFSLGLQITIHHENSFEWRHAAAWSRELRTLSGDEILQPTNRVLIQSRAGPARPRESLPTPEVFFYAEDLHSGGPPWFEDRGPPDRYREPGRTARLPVTLAALNGRVNYPSSPNFRPVDRPN